MRIVLIGSIAWTFDLGMRALERRLCPGAGKLDECLSWARWFGRDPIAVVEYLASYGVLLIIVIFYVPFTKNEFSGRGETPHRR